MSSAGHVLDMIVRMRNNRNLINKSRHFKYKKEYKRHLELSREKLKEITTEERLRIKKLILKQRKREFYIKLTVFYFHYL
jgi:hypothetical protein